MKDLEAEAEGSIVIQIYSHEVVGFPKFYFEMKERLGRIENPWINEFWEFRFNCSNRGHPSLPKCSGVLSRIRRGYIKFRVNVL